MSEYQYYEFAALDRPLSSKEMAELRALSTRAEITPSHFRNEYNWGDLKADPAKLVAKYFDAFLYYANWASYRFMMRLPDNRVDIKQLKQYLPGGSAKLTKVRGHIVIDLCFSDEEPDDDWFNKPSLSTLIPLRSLLLQGDMSPAYLGWLLTVQLGEVMPSTLEPPVPSGLRDLSAPLSALVEFLRIDHDLVKAAAEKSGNEDLDLKAVQSWVSSLPVSEKDRWLVKAALDPSQTIGTDLICAYRRQSLHRPSNSRKVSELLSRTETLRSEREEAESKQAAAAQKKAEADHRKHLGILVREGKKAWERLDQLIASRKYDEAVSLTVDLRDAAQLKGKDLEFDKQMAGVWKRYARRHGYIGAVKRELGKH